MTNSPTTPKASELSAAIMRVYPRSLNYAEQGWTIVKNKTRYLPVQKVANQLLTSTPQVQLANVSYMTK